MALKSLLNSPISVVGDMYRALSNRISIICSAFDIKPIFFLGGLATTGYGIYLKFSLGASLIFVGGVFMLLGYLMRGRS